MVLRWVLIIIFTGLGLQANAEEADDDYLMFVGQLVKTTLYPRERSGVLPERCYLNEEGEEVCELVISNHCGEEVNEFIVLENVHGTRKGETISLSHFLGEWCRPKVSVAGEPLFVFAIKVEKDEKSFFQSDYAIYTYDTSRSMEFSWFYYINNSYELKLCEKYTGVDCEKSFKSVEPLFLNEYSEYNDYGKKFLDKFIERGILMKDQRNEVFFIKAIDIQDLKSRLNKVKKEK
ncbi:MAG: hypothetical protein IIC07_06535 [Proteobacteria bacterium]|nr:hypothetical protein [Pseudomonadota bacterium]